VKSLLPYSETPVSEVFLPELTSAGIRLLVKREDLNHPFVSGNKWWKLKYNLLQAKDQGTTRLLTFGGAYSNHLVAVAAASKELEWFSVGIVRGERPKLLSSTLQFCEQSGMKLQFISRSEYREKERESFIEELHRTHGEFFLIPEGGSNELAVKGVAEFAATLPDADYVCTACGTGGTLAGLAMGLRMKPAPLNSPLSAQQRGGGTDEVGDGGESNQVNSTKVIGFSVLKDESMVNRVRDLTDNDSIKNWEVVQDYHFGGYAKTPLEFRSFMARFEAATRLPLDHVYTGKMFFGVIDLIRKGYFTRGSTVLALHTGGLQGNTIIKG
jgi:1-aminocyclopropane-1-carboxylate deaminase